MERVLQILDDLDDLAACVNHAWLAMAWRGAGLASLATVALVLFLPH